MNDIAKAYAVLTSLKQNLPNAFRVDVSWVNDFHSALAKIEGVTGETLQEFRVSPQELHRETSGGNYMTGAVHYSGRTVIERSRLLMKVDAVLGYFSYQQEKPVKGEIGFTKS